MDNHAGAEPTSELPSRRCRIVSEVIDSERSFIESIRTALAVFVEPWNLSGRTLEECGDLDLAAVLKELVLVVSFSSALLADLEKFQVGKVFRDFGPFLKMFSSYLSHYERWTAKGCRADEVFLSLGEDPRCNGLSLSSFLIMPVQRVPRYKLLLEELLKETSRDDPEVHDLEKALELVAQAAEQNNERIKRQESSLKALSDKLADPSGSLNLLDWPARCVVLGPIDMKKLCRKGPKVFTFWLLSDMIIYAQKTKTGYQLNRVIPLEACVLRDTAFGTISQRSTKRATTLLTEDVTTIPRERSKCFQILSEKKSFIVEAPTIKIALDWRDAVDLLIPAARSRAQYTNSSSGSVVAPIWTPDRAVSKCEKCSRPFDIVRRRHHCRSCGKCFCAECSKYSKIIPSLDSVKKHRVCFQCYNTDERLSRQVRLSMPRTSSLLSSDGTCMSPSQSDPKTDSPQSTPGRESATRIVDCDNDDDDDLLSSSDDDDDDADGFVDAPKRPPPQAPSNNIPPLSIIDHPPSLSLSLQASSNDVPPPPPLPSRASSSEMPAPPPPDYKDAPPAPPPPSNKFFNPFVKPPSRYRNYPQQRTREIPRKSAAAFSGNRRVEETSRGCPVIRSSPPALPPRLSTSGEKEHSEAPLSTQQAGPSSSEAPVVRDLSREKPKPPPPPQTPSWQSPYPQEQQQRAAEYARESIHSPSPQNLDDVKEASQQPFTKPPPPPPLAAKNIPSIIVREAASETIPLTTSGSPSQSALPKADTSCQLPRQQNSVVLAANWKVATVRPQLSQEASQISSPQRVSKQPPPPPPPRKLEHQGSDAANAKIVWPQDAANAKKVGPPDAANAKKVWPPSGSPLASNELSQQQKRPSRLSRQWPPPATSQVSSTTQASSSGTVLMTQTLTRTSNKASTSKALEGQRSGVAPTTVIGERLSAAAVVPAWKRGPVTSYHRQQSLHSRENVNSRWPPSSAQNAFKADASATQYIAQASANPAAHTYGPKTTSSQPPCWPPSDASKTSPPSSMRASSVLTPNVAQVPSSANLAKGGKQPTAPAFESAAMVAARRNAAVRHASDFEQDEEFESD